MQNQSKVRQIKFQLDSKPSRSKVMSLPTLKSRKIIQSTSFKSKSQIKTYRQQPVQLQNFLRKKIGLEDVIISIKNSVKKEQKYAVFKKKEDFLKYKAARPLVPQVKSMPAQQFYDRSQFKHLIKDVRQAALMAAAVMTNSRTQLSKKISKLQEVDRQIVYYVKNNFLKEDSGLVNTFYLIINKILRRQFFWTEVRNGRKSKNIWQLLRDISDLKSLLERNYAQINAC